MTHVAATLRPALVARGTSATARTLRAAAPSLGGAPVALAALGRGAPLLPAGRAATLPVARPTAA